VRIWGIDFEVAVMTADNLLHDRESQTRALARRAGQWLEPLDHLASLRCRNTRTRVFDAHECNAVVTSRVDRHRAAGRCVAQRVVDQVVDELRQQQGIAPDFRTLEPEAEIDPERVRLRYPFSCGRTGDVTQVDDLDPPSVVRRAFGL